MHDVRHGFHASLGFTTIVVKEINKSTMKIIAKALLAMCAVQGAVAFAPAPVNGGNTALFSTAPGPGMPPVVS